MVMLCECGHTAKKHLLADNYPGKLVCCVAWCFCREYRVSAVQLRLLSELRAPDTGED